MTHDRLVDLTTKLHQTNRLSSNEAREFAQAVGERNSELEAVAFRLVTQAYSLGDAEQFSFVCRVLFGRAITGTVQ
jgi:hypothetical protein